MLAEVPGAIMVPADPSNYRPRPQAQEGGAYRLVVIHITSGRENPYNTASMWQKPNHGSSATFVIGQDPLVALQCVPLAFAAQHAHKDVNPYSIGVEHCCREPNEPSFPPGDPGLPPTDAQLDLSARIVAYVLKAGGYPPTRDYVKGHAEVDAYTTHKGCPDAAPWPWQEYMDKVARAYAAIGAAVVE